MDTEPVATDVDIAIPDMDVVDVVIVDIAVDTKHVSELDTTGRHTVSTSVAEAVTDVVVE